MANKKWKPVVFREGSHGKLDANRFADRCRDPRFVAMCLSQYQKWRRGEGEYEWEGSPEARPEMPLCPKALGIVEDYAVRYLNKCRAIIGRQWKM